MSAGVRGGAFQPDPAPRAPARTQRVPLLQVADEVLHVLGHVLGVLQRGMHTPLTALQQRVHRLRGEAACGTDTSQPGLLPSPPFLPSSALHP